MCSPGSGLSWATPPLEPHFPLVFSLLTLTEDLLDAAAGPHSGKDRVQGCGSRQEKQQEHDHCVSWGFCDKSRSPMAQKADIYPFVVLEAESLKLRCKRGTLPPKSRSGSSLPLTASNDSKCSLAGSHLNQTSVSIIIGFRPHLKSVNSEYSLEGLMLKLKLQYFGHLM